LLSFGAETFFSRLLSKNTKRTVALPVVLYGRQTWSLTLRKEQKLRVFENRVLRRIFGPKRDEAKIFQGSMNDAKVFDC
jgi:dihydrofolate reductase